MKGSYRLDELRGVVFGGSTATLKARPKHNLLDCEWCCFSVNTPDGVLDLSIGGSTGGGRMHGDGGPPCASPTPEDDAALAMRWFMMLQVCTVCTMCTVCTARLPPTAYRSPSSSPILFDRASSPTRTTPWRRRVSRQ